MLKDKSIEMYTRGMVVVAHPDDAEFGCSGTVAKWVRQGIEFVYVLCTDGSKGTSDRTITPQELSEMRNNEQIAAGKLLGLNDVVFLNYPDGYLEPSLDLRRDISREIRRFKPDILITTNPTRTLTGSGYIGHPDHFAAGEATLSAVYPAARDHLTFPELLEEGFETHKVREVLIMGHDKPDKWIDVSSSIDIAIEPLLAHKSQLGIEAAERSKEWKKRAGKEHQMEYAEGFKSFTLG